MTLYVHALVGARADYDVGKIAPAIFARNVGHSDERVAEICHVAPALATDFAIALDRFVACCKRGQTEDTPYDGWVVRDPLILGSTVTG